jgi:guanylate kinase
MTTTDSQKPLVFIVSGPSGSGKSTLVEKMLQVPGTMVSVSCTTRPPRTTESPGKWYDFISEAEFERMASRGEFLEYARVFGKHLYGTPRRWIEEAARKGLDLVLEIDVQGAEQVKAKLPAAVSIFILPPAREELERRLRARGQDSQPAIQRRLERAGQEIQRYSEYDFLVVNDDVERAGREIQAIALAARCLRSRISERASEIIQSFGEQGPHDGGESSAR